MSVSGRRVDDHREFYDAPAGAYRRVELESRGQTFTAWIVKPPCGHAAYLSFDPREGRVHEVEEHDDGTITVEPRPENSNSILCARCGWHGWIRAGLWTLS